MTVELTDKGGAPEGNQNAKKGKLFYNQLRKVLVQEDQLKLRKIAEKLVEAAEEGEAWAVKEIMDRVDGKAVQANTLEDAEGNNITTSLEVIFRTPKPIDE
jgi:hypothetical protein